MRYCRPAQQHGFSLIELLIAVGLLTVALASLAQLFALSVAGNVDARFRTSASLLASQKMEELRGLAFGFDAEGAPLTDVTTDTADALPAGGGTGLTPGGSLADSIAGYVDYIDSVGRRTDAAGATYTRRWSIQSMPADPGNTLILQVLVTRRHAASGQPDVAIRSSDDVRVATVRTRKAR